MLSYIHVDPLQLKVLYIELFHIFSYIQINTLHQSAGQKWTTDANYTIQHPQEE